MLLRNARTATPTSSTSRLLRPGLAWPCCSRLINRIPMMFHRIRLAAAVLAEVVAWLGSILQNFNEYVMLKKVVEGLPEN